MLPAVTRCFGPVISRSRTKLMLNMELARPWKKRLIVNTMSLVLMDNASECMRNWVVLRTKNMTKMRVIMTARRPNLSLAIPAGKRVHI